MWFVKLLLPLGLEWLLKRFLPSREVEQGRDQAVKEGLKENARTVKKASAAVRRNRADPERLRKRARKAK